MINMKCKECENETEDLELEMFDGKCLSCHTDSLVEW
jgi:Zn finger protein HypA/HybF involved in hydrogenase expression